MARARSLPAWLAAIARRMREREEETDIYNDDVSHII
jgi:hypothetical protein